VSAAERHNLALTADGAAWSWGACYNGQLGHGDTQRQLLPKKIEAFAGQRVVTVAAGSAHSLAITADGAVFTWGGGAFGKLGHGDEQHELLPKKIETLADQRVVVVSRLDASTASPSPPTAPSGVGVSEVGPRRHCEPASAQEDRGLGDVSEEATRPPRDRSHEYPA